LSVSIALLSFFRPHNESLLWLFLFSLHTVAHPHITYYRQSALSTVLHISNLKSSKLPLATKSEELE
jgi:hypothetical protein